MKPLILFSKSLFYKNQFTHFFVIFLLMSQLGTSYAAHKDSKKPKLILQITVDQLRGDLPERYYERLGKKGFRYLWEQGVVYKNAHHQHANTETIVGHTTLSTGAHPATHGMVGNLWFDRQTKQATYNIEDPNYHLLTEGADVDKSNEIDPTQRAAKNDGRSPLAILTTTFSDELKINTNGLAKVFGVSVKDRGAVAMAGHAGKAFWFSKAKGEFVTSNYYYDKYPEWVSLWNSKKLAQQYAGTSWKLLQDKNKYLFGQSDDRSWETDIGGFGRVFPHAYGTADSKYYTTLLTLSPAGDELTLAFAKELMRNEKLGQDNITDYLSISFSATDYVGHIFGPSSLEQEDNILRLDQTLSKLFQFIDMNVGLKNTLIVLSSDHGSPETPGYLKSLNIPAGYIETEQWDTQPAIVRVKKQFNIKGKLIEKYVHPYLYLNAELEKSGIDQRVLENAVIAELLSFPGVYTAVSSQAIQNGNYPDTSLYRSVVNNHYPERSGDIYIVFKPHWFINDFDGLTVASSHGSPWKYDTHIPIVFAGAGLPPKIINQAVYSVDIAPTLSAIMNIKAPSGSAGHLLEDVLQRKE